MTADLSTSGWVDALRDAGCDIDDVRTLVLCEGCTYYLTEDAIKQTLRYLRYPLVTFSFDFGDRSIMDGQLNANGEDLKFVVYVRFLEDPFRFSIDHGALSNWLQKQAWEDVDSVAGPEDVKLRFLPGATECSEPFSFFALAIICPLQST